MHPNYNILNQMLQHESVYQYNLAHFLLTLFAIPTSCYESAAFIAQLGSAMVSLTRGASFIAQLGLTSRSAGAAFIAQLGGKMWNAIYAP